MGYDLIISGIINIVEICLNHLRVFFFLWQKKILSIIIFQREPQHETFNELQLSNIYRAALISLIVYKSISQLNRQLIANYFDN